MTRFRLIFAFLLSCAAAKRAGALFLTLGGADPAVPLEAAYTQTGNLSFTRTVEIANPSPAGLSILSWQTEFKLNPLVGAQGQLKFSAVEPSPNPRLANFGGPYSDLTEPSNQLQVFDHNEMDPDGSPIAAGERFNLMNVTITASSDASGDFELLTPTFIAEKPDLGSSWFPASSNEPIAFENAATSSLSGYVLLAVFQIGQGYPLGDYDRDHHVTEADYLRWRTEYGLSVPAAGDRADGNLNGVVDGADYVLWRRQHASASSATLASEAAVPESGFLATTLAALALSSRATARDVRAGYGIENRSRCRAKSEAYV